jgi:hypothetical protein
MPGQKANRETVSLAKTKGLAKKAILAARSSHKLLPHELLLLWANGIEIAGVKPTPAQQLYSAVAAAPFYAPKLANVEVKQDVRLRAVISAQPMTQDQWARKYLNTQENIEVEAAKQIPTDIVSENYFSTGKNIEGGEGVPVGTVSQQPIEGLLGKVISVGIDNVLGGVLIGAQPVEILEDFEAAGLNSEKNRKSSNDVYIPPSSAHANLSCSTDTNDVCKDEDL